MILESKPMTGLDSYRSRAFPCGTPSRMSISATSASSRRAISCATCSPTKPAPTTVTFLLMNLSMASDAPPWSKVGDDRRAELRALEDPGPLDLPPEVVGHCLLADRGLQSGDDARGRL